MWMETSCLLIFIRNRSIADYNCNIQFVLSLSADFFLSSLSQPHSAEIQEQLLSCLSSDCLSTREYGDKKVNKPRHQVQNAGYEAACNSFWCMSSKCGKMLLRVIVKTKLPVNSQLLVASGASHFDQLQLIWNSKGFPLILSPGFRTLVSRRWRWRQLRRVFLQQPRCPELQQGLARPHASTSAPLLWGCVNKFSLLLRNAKHHYITNGLAVKFYNTQYHCNKILCYQIHFI